MSFDAAPRDSNTAVISYKNTGYRTQNDRWLFAQGVPNYNVDWVSVFETLQGELGMLKTDPSERIYGTTVTASHIRGSKITTAHVGDCRVTILLVDSKERSVKEKQLTKEHSNGFNLDTNQETRVFPDVRSFNFESLFLSGNENAEMFLMLETDGVHLYSDEGKRGAFLKVHLDMHPDFNVNPHSLAKFFTALALGNGSKDNMTICVSKITKSDRERSDILGVFDGAGEGGFLASDAAKCFVMENAAYLPRDSRAPLSLG